MIASITQCMFSTESLFTNSTVKGFGNLYNSSRDWCNISGLKTTTLSANDLQAEKCIPLWRNSMKKTLFGLYRIWAKPLMAYHHDIPVLIFWALISTSSRSSANIFVMTEFWNLKLARKTHLTWRQFFVNIDQSVRNIDHPKLPSTVKYC